MPEFVLRAITGDDVAQFVGWRYPPPYDTYNVGAGDGVVMLDPVNRFSSVFRDDELIAYVCLGAEARVPGLEAVAGVDDLGFGLRPDLMGQGLSRELLPWLLDALSDQIEAAQLRVVILDWNARSLAAYRRAGFVDVGSVSNGEGIFLLLTRPAPRPGSRR